MTMKKLFLFIPALLLASCNGFKSIKSALNDKPPYERYVESLEKAGLLKAVMAKEWLSAGQRAFLDSVFVTIPFSESGFFEASAPQARSYRFTAKDGQVLTVKTTLKAGADTKLFLDLFTLEETKGQMKWEHAAYGDSTLSITHEFNRNEDCLLRIQPELLANAWYAIDISLTPVLINPVYGASNKSIGSFYGASRDNGQRSHEGVDIFAPKGTPVVAPTDGYISRVGLNRLGGKVVWMKDTKRGHSYYFAHLDSQMVSPGTRVSQGHVLGSVGNTGNARTTPPHLHFGIYQSGSKDPLHYIQQMEDKMASVPIDTGFHQKPLKVRAKKASLFSGPSTRLTVKTSLKKDTYVTVLGQSNDWYRISLPDETEGYVQKSYLTDLTTGRQQKLDSTAIVLSHIDTTGVPVEVVKEKSAVEVLAHFRDFTFVRTESGNAGWIAN